ncbi:thiamine phosphate synthase [Anaerostipes sp.]|uniref:thiamine phosphate synthase n=1 Tax=Anaerostipes sp. TaxID=1872530 RepID=UPI0025BB0F78|nr:thiamine phosphate synthase [Anaerostipes sp.]MBS7008530.1 thiamine phosphate synthase [Anaerostipes sp.]
MNRQWIAVTSRKLCGQDFLEVIRTLAGQGLKTIILREKDLKGREYEQLAEECMEICRREGASLTLHNDIEAARRLQAKRIHLPFPVFQENQGKLDGFSHVSTSVHAVEEAVEAEKMGADFVIAGHIFQTDCKKGVPPRGLSFLRETAEAVSVPVYGIGGITPHNIEEVLAAGAAGGCMMSGFMKSPKMIDKL